MLSTLISTSADSHCADSRLVTLRLTALAGCLYVVTLQVLGVRDWPIDVTFYLKRTTQNAPG
jgi:hypothetical protein